MRLLVGLLVAVALTAAACGSDGASSCIEIREPLDPLFTQHVIDPDGLTYLTDPPTSGPHLSGPSISGLLAEGLIPAAQVRVLEEGVLVVQYEDSVAVEDLQSLLDANEVPIAIAPAESLPSPVVATAWTWKLTCDGPDLARIREFAGRTAAAPGTD